MYAILISIALAAYSLILVDFTNLFQEISVNMDLLTSTQALYTAEGAAEQAFYQANSPHDVTKRNTKFIYASRNSETGPDAYLDYNEGAASSYVGRKLISNGGNLAVADRIGSGNRVADSNLQPNVYYDPEPLSSRGFVIREANTRFDKIRFSYNKISDQESSELLFEVFTFPRDGEPVAFPDFKTLKEGGIGSVKRLSVNTLDQSNSGMPKDSLLSVSFGQHEGSYSNGLLITGFQPLSYNYLIRFQTLDNKPTHYSLSAMDVNAPVQLPNITQTVDVIGTTPTGLFQRVKMQRQTEEGLMPGLQFVHFTNDSINK